MRCSNCGEENVAGATFCMKCGTPLASDGGEATVQPSSTSLGLAPNLASALCYVVGWVTGLVILLVEKQNNLVRFHALQSVIVFGSITVLQILLGIVVGILWRVPVLGALIGAIPSLVSLATFVLWIVLIVKAYQGERYHLPIAGEITEQYLPSI